MTVFRFKIEYDGEEIITREYELAAAQSFRHFNEVILQSLGVEKQPNTVFINSDNNWHEEEEIVAFTKDDELTAKDDKKLKLTRFIHDPHQRFWFHIDSDFELSFQVELIGIKSSDSIARLPKCVTRTGDFHKTLLDRLNGKKPEVEAKKELENGEAEDDDLMEPSDEELGFDSGFDEADWDGMQEDDDELGSGFSEFNEEDEK